MGRYRHKVYEKSTAPRWVAVFGLQWQVIESYRLEPGAELLGAMTAAIDRLTAEGWRAESEPRFGFVFITKELEPGAIDHCHMEVATDEVREASRGESEQLERPHKDVRAGSAAEQDAKRRGAPDSPSPGEHRDMRTARPDGENRRLLMLTPRDPFDTRPQAFSPFHSA
jgi:hypothetical protein